MQKSSVQKYCSLLKPKIPLNRAPNERNMKGGSITINFHSSQGEETYLKAKNVKQISQACFATRPCVQIILILHAAQSQSSEFLQTTFAVILSAVALPIVPKVEFYFQAIMYIAIFVFLSPGSCFESVICIQNSLESAWIVMFLRRLKEGKILHQKGLRTLYFLIFHSEAT